MLPSSASEAVSVLESTSLSVSPSLPVSSSDSSLEPPSRIPAGPNDSFDSWVAVASSLSVFVTASVSVVASLSLSVVVSLPTVLL